MTAEPFAARLDEALTRQPDTAWIRPGLALLGWGEAARIEPGTGADRFDRALRELHSSRHPAALASFTFDENGAGSVVLVPEVLMRIDGDAIDFLVGSSKALPPARPAPALPRGRLREEPPGHWMSSVGGALAAIRAREIEKVVLSRQTLVELESEISPSLVMSRLAAREPTSHTFLVDGFVGSSPELLVSLKEGRARSTSLAGSADLGSGARSFDNEKMALEHGLAADSVEEALAPLCVRLERSPTRIATYGEIRHLSTSFGGDTRPGTVITDLLSNLHPTAAVAGTPTKSALELIRELEHHDRGRYAGPVGWLDESGEGEFAIALRCGLVEGRFATLHSGAGIVDGSDAALELEETRMKLRPMMGALGLS